MYIESKKRFIKESNLFQSILFQKNMRQNARRKTRVFRSISYKICILLRNLRIWQLQKKITRSDFIKDTHWGYILNCIKTWRIIVTVLGIAKKSFTCVKASKHNGV